MEYRPTRMPTKPCHHPPGSRERIATYRARVLMRMHLHHPDDTRLKHNALNLEAVGRMLRAESARRSNDDRHGLMKGKQN